ncbi:MAG: TRAP transporter substrate-binding protein [Acetobacteraceae bacterium]
MARGYLGLLCGLTLAAASLWPLGAGAQVRHFRLGYDEPTTTGYGIAADIFAAKLSELSHGAMVVDQFPNAQLGQEPQLLQLVRSGDVDFVITTTANAATASPQSGVMSLHYLFRSEAHLKKVLADPGVVQAMRAMYDQTVSGAHMLALLTLGMRDMYGAKPIRSLADLQGLKVRVQATATEDALFAVYGAQTVHMPFGSVYTSLQTGVIGAAENSPSVYLENKHYEVSPVLSMTDHEPNNSVLWVSDKVMSSLSEEQKGWVRAAGDEVGRTQPDKAIALVHQAVARLQKLGVQIVTDVDRAQLQKVAEPLQAKLAEQLGPQAVQIMQLCRAVPD